MTEFAILRPSCLTAEDRTSLPASKQLSILAAESVGLELRRRTTILRTGAPLPQVVFDWRDPQAPPAPNRALDVPTWKPSPPMYATDLGKAIDLVADAARRGYLVTIVAQEQDGARTCTAEFRGLQRAYPGWTVEARATALGPTAEAEAITIAYLTLTRSIHPLEDACPSPR